MGGPVDRPSLLGAPPPSRFEVRMTAIAPGHTLAYRNSDWRDALVVVEHGAIDLEWLSGARQRLDCGAVLWLAGLRLRALDNRGLEPAVLLAIKRRRPSLVTSRPRGVRAAGPRPLSARRTRTTRR
jgi:quercetin dioxygenase-like cupin family protein